MAGFYVLLKKPPLLSPVCVAGVGFPCFPPGSWAGISVVIFFSPPWNIHDGDLCEKHKLLPSSPHSCWFTKRNGKGFRMERSFILYRGICIGRCQKWSSMCTTAPWDFPVASCAGDPRPAPGSLQGRMHNPSSTVGLTLRCFG